MRLQLLLVVALAGCLSAPTPAPWDTGPAMEHDHNDVHLHTGSHNIDFVGWSALGVTLGANGFANFVTWQDADEKLAFVAVDGDTRGGFVIADIADPAAPTAIGAYMVPGNGLQEVRVTPDGRYAVLNVQDVPDPAAVPTDGPGVCSVCIHIVDIRDRSAPEMVGFMPVELLGTHNFHFEEYEDGLYLFAVGQPLGVGPVPLQPGNHVWVYRFQELPSGASLVPVSSLERTYFLDDGRSFPHDVMVQDHPDGRKIAYVSHWDGGHVTFDVTDPMAPVELGVHADAAPSDALAVHWMWQEAAARPDGRVIAWSAPEIGTLSTGSGVIRALDVTDPAAMAQLGTWELPGDIVIEDAPYIFSPHTAIPNHDQTLLAVGHYHAGLWILDIRDPAAPVHVGFFEPHGDPAEPYGGPIWWKKPNFDPDGYGPNVYQARWDTDDPTLLWVTDRGTGLYALRFTGDA